MGRRESHDQVCSSVLMGSEIAPIPAAGILHICLHDYSPRIYILVLNIDFFVSIFLLLFGYP